MLYYHYHHIRVSWQPDIPAEVTGPLNRPECGWYELYSYYLKEDQSLSPDTIYIRKADAEGIPYRLALLEFNLRQYRDGSLSKTALANIENVLTAFENTDMKLIIRFLYDWDGHGKKSEPEDLDTVLTHMEQVGPVITRHEKQIYTMQGIFVGSWAEMHHSNHLSVKSMTTLLEKLAQVTPSSLFLAVRTPAQYRTVLQQIQTYPEYYEKEGVPAAELISRLGLFNDSILASKSDNGTYGTQTKEDTTSIRDAYTREEELDFQNTLCLRVPNGGETVNVNFYNELDNAITDLGTMHISYLNQTYDLQVIDRWKHSSYSGDHSLYQNLSGYDYITDHLGYRFVLRSAELLDTSGKNANGIITIENTGFANAMFPKSLSLNLTNTATGETTSLISSGKSDTPDIRNWNAGTKTELSFSLLPYDYEEGTYTLWMRITDPDTGEIISFANQSSVMKDGKEGYPLGTLTISR